MLREALDHGSVLVGAEPDDWRKAVEASGKLLVDVGAAEEGYVAAMVRTTEELGAYAILDPGIAIPHARPEDGAMRVGLSLAVLSKPVEFGSEENDPVDLVFDFSITDSEAHVELLQALADFIEKPENTEALRSASTVEEVLRVVERSEGHDPLREGSLRDRRQHAATVGKGDAYSYRLNGAAVATPLA